MLYDPILVQCLLASSGTLFIASVVLLIYLCRSKVSIKKEPVVDVEVNVDVEQVNPDVDVERVNPDVDVERVTKPILRPKRKTPRALFLEEYFTHHKETRLQLEIAKQEWRNLSYEEKSHYEQLAYQHQAYQQPHQ